MAACKIADRSLQRILIKSKVKEDCHIVLSSAIKTQIRKQQCSDRHSAGLDRTGDEDHRSSLGHMEQIVLSCSYLTLGHMKQIVLSCSYLWSQRHRVKSDRND